ncbi:MAG: hypothetical protein ACK5D5_13970 [Bacteroidota bacterium]
MKKTHNILVFTYWSYHDPLIQAYTLPYLKIIKNLNPENISIHLITLEKKNSKANSIDKNILSSNIRLKYYPVGITAAVNWIISIFIILKTIKKNKINALHSWCTPAGMIAYIISVITKIRLIADSYEPHAESMVENGSWKKKSWAFKTLFYFEKKIALHSSHIISIAPEMNNYIKNKYALDIKIKFVKPACVDLDKFNISNRKNLNLIQQLNIQDKIICLYAGKFGGIYYDKEVFDFFKSADKFFGDKIIFLILSNQAIESINQKIVDSGISKDKFIIRSIPHDQMPEWVGLADFAICPVKPVPTKKYCSPIKTGEYWAMGLPIIITKNISNDSQIIEDSGMGYVWKEMTTKEFEISLVEVKKIISSDVKSYSEKIRNLAIDFRNFEIARDIYREIYD